MSLISLKAGGVGVNLTGADTVILYDPWWNPAVEEQAIDRAHRIGQDKPVFVHKLVMTGTIEEKMEALKEKKRALAEKPVLRRRRPYARHDANRSRHVVRGGMIADCAARSAVKTRTNDRFVLPRDYG